MFLQPEKVPVKVYLSTDKDAPRLDRTPNCVQTILKACLVTGYGEKEPAGWTMPFEDTAKGVKVLQPADSPHIPFFVRLSGDTGREMTVQVYQEMTSVDDGVLKLSIGSNQKLQYSAQTNSEHWVLVASERSFYFALERSSAGSVPLNKSGLSIFCGDTIKNTQGERAVVLVYSANYGFFNTSTGTSNQAAILTTAKQGSLYAKSQFDGAKNLSKQALLSPVLLEFDGEIYALPFYSSSNTQSQNRQEIQGYGRIFINHGHAAWYATNAYVPIDYWEY